MSNTNSFTDERAIYYGDLAEYNVQKAFSEVRDEILVLQNELRSKLPKKKSSILLHLVTITGDDSLKFDDEFAYHLAEFVGVQRNNMNGNFYYGLGQYV